MIINIIKYYIFILIILIIYFKNYFLTSSKILQKKFYLTLLNLE